MIQSINFVASGSAPQRTRNTETQRDLQAVLDKMKEYKPGQGDVVINLGTTAKKHAAAGLARRLRSHKAFNPKEWDCYYVGNQVVIKAIPKAAPKGK